MARILYLHGFTSSPRSKKASYFRSRFAEAGIDLEISELDEGNFEALTITGQLNVIERCAADGPVSLIGSSLGGYLAALYAARHPEVSQVVLLAPAFGFAKRLDDSGEWRQAGYREFFHYGNQEPRRLGYQLVEDAARYEDFPDFPQPGLIFHGRYDDAVPVEYSQQFAERRSNVRLEILDSDHELLNMLDYLWAEIKKFLMDGELRAKIVGEVK